MLSSINKTIYQYIYFRNHYLMTNNQSYSFQVYYNLRLT